MNALDSILDNDGYGDPNNSTDACPLSEGYNSLNSLDCDDTNWQINPAVPEIVRDGIDQDCVDGDQNVDLSLSGYTGCFINDTGTLSCWGDDEYSLFDDLPSTPVSSITTYGNQHFCSTDAAGQVTCTSIGTTKPLL